MASDNPRAEYHRAYQVARYRRDPEYRKRVSAAMKKWRERHREQYNKNTETWRERNREYYNKYHRDYARRRRLLDPEFRAREYAAHRRYSLKNPEKMRAYAREVATRKQAISEVIRDTWSCFAEQDTQSLQAYQWQQD